MINNFHRIPAPGFHDFTATSEINVGGGGEEHKWRMDVESIFFRRAAAAGKFEKNNCLLLLLQGTFNVTVNL